MGRVSPVISFSFSVILEMVSELRVAAILVVEVSVLVDGNGSLWRMIPGNRLMSMKPDMMIYDSQTFERRKQIEMLGSWVLKRFYPWCVSLVGSD